MKEDVDLQKLKKLAEIKERALCANPGPWKAVIEDGDFFVRMENGWPIADCHGLNDANYMAAVSPDVVLELIAEIEDLRANNYGPDILNDPHALTAAYMEGAMDKGRADRDKIEFLERQIENLNKEADWLAEQLLCCTDDNRVDTCQYVSCRHLCANKTVQDWRKAAAEETINVLRREGGIETDG